MDDDDDVADILQYYYEHRCALLYVHTEADSRVSLVLIVISSILNLISLSYYLDCYHHVFLRFF